MLHLASILSYGGSCSKLHAPTAGTALTESTPMLHDARAGLMLVYLTSVATTALLVSSQMTLLRAARIRSIRPKHVRPPKMGGARPDTKVEQQLGIKQSKPTTPVNTLLRQTIWQRATIMLGHAICMATGTLQEPRSSWHCSAWSAEWLLCRYIGCM